MDLKVIGRIKKNFFIVIIKINKISDRIVLMSLYSPEVDLKVICRIKK